MGVRLCAVGGAVVSRAVRLVAADSLHLPHLLLCSLLLYQARSQETTKTCAVSALFHCSLHRPLMVST